MSVYHTANAFFREWAASRQCSQSRPGSDATLPFLLEPLLTRSFRAIA